MKNTTFNLSPLAKAFAMTTAVALSSQAFAQEETEVKEKDVEKIQVTGSLGSLPGQDVESVFGLQRPPCRCGLVLGVHVVSCSSDYIS